MLKVCFVPASPARTLHVSYHKANNVQIPIKFDNTKDLILNKYDIPIVHNFCDKVMGKLCKQDEAYL